MQSNQRHQIPERLRWRLRCSCAHRLDELRGRPELLQELDLALRHPESTRQLVDRQLWLRAPDLFERLGLFDRREILTAVAEDLNRETRGSRFVEVTAFESVDRLEAFVVRELLGQRAERKPPPLS